MKRFQALLQALFLRADRLFNAAFGDRLNPLYHLGEIAFFLFWLVAASGLYLYAFFETGVSAAYGSVEALTHSQWFAGGLLRSLHRYASDGMAAVLLLHMLRHFAFDRFRGLRAFSWLTGVGLVWGVWISGINGYMLPWDRVAQLTVIASFEWLDWLPMFGGTLMRNFMYVESVSDRFFSLLSFMHVGLPLAVLMLMWIHVQRVPKASTTPPRAIAVALTSALLALSLLHPALSQGGPADLATTVTSIRLDWFYLAMLPLIAAWPLGQVWALAGIGTALLALAPWLPPWRRSRAQAHRLTVQVAGKTAQATLRPGETLLEAGLREGLALPYACRNGGCGVCVCTVRSGHVGHRPFQRSALSQAQQDAGQALLCCAVAEDDVSIEVGDPAAAAPVGEYTATVSAMERLAPDVMRLQLTLPAGQRLAFAAGQYIQVLLDDGARRAFSFASAPHATEGTDSFELHVRLIPGGRFTPHVFQAMRTGDTLRFEGPLGRFTLQESERPILFVAGATGFAPVRSIVEDAFQRGLRRPMRLYWGARRPQDLYLLDLALAWERKHPNFSLVPVVSEPRPEDGWTGRTGLVHQAMLADFPDLAGQEVYVCGSVRMVDAAVHDLLAQGLDEGACFSDAFTPAATVTN